VRADRAQAYRRVVSTFCPKLGSPSRSGGCERGAPGSGQQGADEGEDAARRPGGAAEEEVRLRRVRQCEVWRKEGCSGVREGRGRGASDTGAPGPGPGRCEAGPDARARSGRVVLRLKPPQPRDLMGGRPEPACTPRGCAACPPAGSITRAALSAALLRRCAPVRHLSTGLQSFLCSSAAPLLITLVDVDVKAGRLYVHGENFGTSGAVVRFAGLPVSVVEQYDTSLTVAVPASLLRTVRRATRAGRVLRGRPVPRPSSNAWW